MFIILQNMNK